MSIVNPWGDEDAYDNGYQTCRQELARTLTRLSKTMTGALDYHKAIAEIAETHRIKARTITETRWEA